MAENAVFQAEYDALIDAYCALDCGDTASSPTPVRSSVAQRQLEIQSQIAHLCVTHGDLRRAVGHFDNVKRWIEEKMQSRSVVPLKNASEEKLPPSDDSEVAKAPSEAPDSTDSYTPEFWMLLPELLVNVLANTGALRFRLDDSKAAMGDTLNAKKLLREIAQSDARKTELTKLEMVVTANYAALLQAQGSLDDALTAAERVLDLADQTVEKAGDSAQDESQRQSQLTALGIVTSCYRNKDSVGKAHDAIRRSVVLLKASSEDSKADAAVMGSIHNNLGLYFYERRDFQLSLHHLLEAYRLAVTSRHDEEQNLLGTVRLHLGMVLDELHVSADLPDKNGVSTTTTSRDCFLSLYEAHIEEKLRVLAQVCRGDLEYCEGDFAGAEADLTISLERVITILERETTPSRQRQELLKIQSYINSALGCVLLSAGKIEAAEEAHQRDLEVALESEDIYAQLRALRNLATLYTTTERFDEAITLWRETVEIAVVVASKRDLMVSYAGLGAALHQLSIADHSKYEFTEMLREPENQPRRIFLKQRTLAIEVGDNDHQLMAQKWVVATYEWAQRPEELEQRLEECDAFVRLCEQYDGVLYKPHAYRCLANAITVQIARLAERGARFAEAINVLKFKRTATLQKLRDAGAAAGADENMQQVRPSRANRVDVLSQSIF